jgi:hypothetical protein
MARAGAFVAGLVLGVALATGIMISHADDVDAEVSYAAAAAHVDPTDLRGAVNSTGLDPWQYLRATGEFEASHAPATGHPPPTERPSTVRVDCIIAHESHGNAGAVNPRSGASGLGQFLLGTWLSTPQGRAGLSRFDPAANRAAITWMLQVGRAREFAVVGAGLC